MTGPDAPTLRPLGPADADTAAALIRRAFAAQPVATDPPSSALGETTESVASQIAAGGVPASFATARLRR